MSKLPICHGRMPQAPKFGGNIPAVVAASREKTNRRTRIIISVDLIVAAICIGALLAIAL